MSSRKLIEELIERYCDPMLSPRQLVEAMDHAGFTDQLERAIEQRLDPELLTEMLLLGMRLVVNAAKAAASGPSVSPEVLATGGQRVRVGKWSFDLPSDWKPGDHPKFYMQSANNRYGIYADELRGHDIADQVGIKQQSNALVGWSSEPPREGSVAGCQAIFIESRDRRTKYRVRDVFVRRGDDGLRLALHDYVCDNLDGRHDVFERILASVR